MTSQDYLDAVLHSHKYEEEGLKYYTGTGSEDPIELLREYARDLDLEIPSELEEDAEVRQRIRQQNDKGFQYFTEALDFIAMETLLEDDEL